MIQNENHKNIFLYKLNFFSFFERLKLVKILRKDVTKLRKKFPFLIY